MKKKEDKIAPPEEPVKKKPGLQRADKAVIFIFLSIAVICLVFFWLDLMFTFELRNVEPVGHIVIKRNVVQRRLADRVLWDRLANESPVYLGDLIRIAEVSAATLYLEGNSLDLTENTLIRITRAPDGEGIQIFLTEGNLSLAATAEGSRISLDINGHLIQTDSGTVLNASSSASGFILQVNEGQAYFISDGETREIGAGRQLNLDSDGLERNDKFVSIVHPALNTHFINDSAAPYTVNFSWNRINLGVDELLRLEISADRNFNSIFSNQINLYNQALANLGNGIWYWRLTYTNIILGEGRFTIIDGTGPQLQSPAVSSVFNFTEELPLINFQWDNIDNVSSYILEVSDSSEFTSAVIRRQSQITSYTDSSLGEGTWYWRVKPEFPFVYIGDSIFSQVSFFRIEQGEEQEEETELAEWLVREVPPDLRPPPELHLRTPVQRARINGLTALRQQTVFAWECEAELVKSRFVLSRNANPFDQPAVEIFNPDKNISGIRLDVGTWYWNIEVETEDGFTVMAAEHGILQVMAITLLPAPQNLQPAGDHRYITSDLRMRRNIRFTWQAVNGANAYIFTLYQQTASGRRQIVRSQPITRTNYVLDDLRVLDRGTFIWQVEAINRRQDGTIDQRGEIAERSFVMDFVLPSPIQVEGTGVIDEI